MLLCLLLSTQAVAQQVVVDYEQTISAKGIEALEVYLTDANVTLIGTQRNEIYYRVVRKLWLTDSLSTDNPEEFSIEQQSRGGTLQLQESTKEINLALLRNPVLNKIYKVYIEVPASLPVSLKGTHANYLVRNHFANLSFVATNMTLDVENCRSESFFVKGETVVADLREFAGNFTSRIATADLHIEHRGIATLDAIYDRGIVQVEGPIRPNDELLIATASGHFEHVLPEQKHWSVVYEDGHGNLLEKAAIDRYNTYRATYLIDGGKASLHMHRQSSAMVRAAVATR
jgi:hypothetical protein